MHPLLPWLLGSCGVWKYMEAKQDDRKSPQGHKWSQLLKPQSNAEEAAPAKIDALKCADSSGLPAEALLRSGADAPWQCFCTATDHTIKHTPLPETKNGVHEHWVFAATEATALGSANCTPGQLVNPFEGHPQRQCRSHLPVYSAFPPKIEDATIEAENIAIAMGSSHIQESYSFTDANAKIIAEADREWLGLADMSHQLVREWLGTIRPWHWDCRSNTYPLAYAVYSPSRAADCIHGFNPGSAESRVPAALPIVDEEYFELADVLMSVASAPPHETYNVVEIGARYAPFAVRALMAVKALKRSRRGAYAVVVEPLSEHIAWAHQHFRLNGFLEGTEYKSIQAFFGKVPPPAPGAPVKAGARAVTLAEALEGLDHIDMLDIDAQSAEAFLVQSPADAEALRKVRRAHIETHSAEVGEIVIRTLREHGFRVLRNASAQLYDQYHAPALGKLMFRGGSVYASNERAPNTLHGKC